MKKVLIIDDEIDLCTLIKSFLSKRDYEVIAAHTLKEGIQLVETFTPDALLLDNNLPDGMGWNQANSLHKRFPKMHITLISAFHQTKEYNATINDSIHILEKPISLNDLEKYL